MPSDAVSLQHQILEFKSAAVTLPVLAVAHGDLDLLARALEAKLAQAPEFFKNSPVMLDLQKLSEQHRDLAVQDLIDILSAHQLIAIGVRGGYPQHAAEAAALNLPVFSAQNAGAEQARTEKQPASPAPARRSADNKLILQPVRSGQRVYASGDLTIVASVSAGAEIMAEGNIHVYGSLRGRALAGVQGDRDSRIFCSDLRAELISIAGVYQLADEDAPHPPVQKWVCIRLQEQKLIVEKI